MKNYTNSIYSNLYTYNNNNNQNNTCENKNNCISCPKKNYIVNDINNNKKRQFYMEAVT
jgi:hypothetical protein